MVRYFYVWIPYVLLTTIFILACPWLGVIALLVLLFAVVATLGAIAWSIVTGLSALGRSVSGRLSRPSHSTSQVALAPARVRAEGMR